VGGVGGVLGEVPGDAAADYAAAYYEDVGGATMVLFDVSFGVERLVGGGSGGWDEVEWFIVASAVLLCIFK
jgi:hypothetical protein